MAQCYIDASAKGDTRLLVMAGYIAPAENWAEFSRVWQTKLDDAKIPYFKMHEWANRPEIAAFFYRTLEEADIPAAVSCVIRTEEMRQVIRSLQWPPNVIDDGLMENPYMFAFKAITTVLIQRQVEFGIREPIDFIFDEENEKVYTIRGWDLIKLAMPPDLIPLLGDTPKYKDDKKVLPLQAADLLAWWIRKRALDGTEIAKISDIFPWPIKRPIVGLHMDLGKDEIRYEMNRMLEPENLARARAHAIDPHPARTFEFLKNARPIVTFAIRDPWSPWWQCGL